MSGRLRIYLTGVGGQGTLTATTLLSRTVMDQGIEVVSGEIHGMAQRGGVVESTVLLGGWHSPGIYHGQADILLGFEPLETLRGLAYLRSGGSVLSSTEFVPPPGVSVGRESLPEADAIERQIRQAAGRCWFLPLQSLGREAGAVQSGNTALLGALCATGLLPFGPDALRASVKKYLPPKVVEVNLRALELGIAAVAGAGSEPKPSAPATGGPKSTSTSGSIDGSAPETGSASSPSASTGTEIEPRMQP